MPIVLNLLPNGSIDHASALIENLLSHAESRVRIFTGKLNPEVYGRENIVDAISIFLKNPDARIEILTQDGLDDSVENPFIVVCQNKKNQCAIKNVSESDKLLEGHFVVVDDKAYRFESNKNKLSAVACFNNKNIALKLVDAFENMFDRGVENKELQQGT